MVYLVEKLCDRVGVIIDGKLVCCDEVSNITKEKNLEDVFNGKQVDITGPNSKVKVLVIPTNEELMIAKETMALVTK